MAGSDPSAPYPSTLVDDLFERILDRLELAIDLAAAADRLVQLGILATTCRELADMSASALLISREESGPPHHLPLDF